MSTAPRTTIAQMLFGPDVPVVLGDVVTGLGSSLAGGPGLGHRLTWDGPAVAIMELGASRVMLIVTSLPLRSRPTCLSVCVGDVPGLSSDLPLDARHAKLGALIVEKIEAMHATDTVIWQEVATGLSRPVVQELTDLIVLTELAHDDPTRPRKAEDLPRTADQDTLGSLRTLKYPVEAPKAERASVPLRIAASAVNCTLAVVALPVGAALIAHSLQHGADMRLSARVLALTGTVIAVGQSMVAQGILPRLG